MAQLHPQFACKVAPSAGGKVLICRGTIRPTPIHASYHARIEYRIPIKPKVWIEAPKLERRQEDQRIPHTYADDRPCLFKEDFRSDMALARTVVPWLALWLVFYESWRITGEWQGGGLHPTPQDLERASDVTE